MIIFISYCNVELIIIYSSKKKKESRRVHKLLGQPSYIVFLPIIMLLKYVVSVDMLCYRNYLCYY